MKNHSLLGWLAGWLAGWLGWEAQLYVFYVSWRLWEAHLYVFYVSWRLWEVLEGSGRANLLYCTRCAPPRRPSLILSVLLSEKVSARASLIPIPAPRAGGRTGAYGARRAGGTERAFGAPRPTGGRAGFIPKR